jgi:hypothetical protein
VYISTDPDCGTFQEFTVKCRTGVFAPDFLQPNTTYYWRPDWNEEACTDGWNGGAAAVQSFTTEGPNATQESTWGRVKSLYRD